MFLLLLLACPFEPPADDGAADVCVPVETREAALAWDEPTREGVSAADLFGFAVGTFSGSLAWDDGATTDLTLVVRPAGAREVRDAGGEGCLSALEGRADFTLATADGRLDEAGEAVWSVGGDWLDVPLPNAWVGVALDPADLGFSRLDETSTLAVYAVVDDEGRLDHAAVEERWTLDAETTRACVRASTDPAELGCRDLEEDDPLDH